MARILLGVSGGIAAYKMLEFSRLAIKSGHSVRVVQTPDSLNFVGRASFEGITGAPVLVGQFDTDPSGGAFPGQPRPDHDPIGHLELAANCDIYVIAPATANTIAKLAAGAADNMLTALVLSCRRPLLVAPAMNNEMYLNAATAENIATLTRRGMHVLEPDTGELASKGEYGIGRLPEPAALLAAAERLIAETSNGATAVGERDAATAGFAPRPLDGLKLLISAGGTREPIDAVRFVGNRSSGRMGFALADEAAARGGEVTVIAANVALPRNPAVVYVDVSTAAELETAVRERLPACDVLVMAAAVADFRPAEPRDDKIKKGGRDELELRMVATSDVLVGVGNLRRDDQVIVGFAAEAGEQLLEEAKRKLESKGLDLIVANDISNAEIGFESEINEVTMLGADLQPLKPPRGDKREVAAAILERVAELVDQRAPTSRTR